MNSPQRFDTRAWLLFAAMAVLWGIPYLFISIAVESYSPAAVVAGRTLLGALLLLPFALKRFTHPQKGAIIFGYLASNLLFTAAVIAVLVLRFGKR